MNTTALDITKLPVHPRFTPEQAKYWLLIREAILAEGGIHYDQGVLITSCGSPCCIWGHTAEIVAGVPWINTSDDLLVDALGLKMGEMHRILPSNASWWKAPFSTLFVKAKTQFERATVAGNYILSILQTGEV